jgi:hypothetical protein
MPARCIWEIRIERPSAPHPRMAASGSGRSGAPSPARTAGVRYLGAGLHSRLGLLVGMVLANRPWRLDPACLARLTGVPAPNLKTVHALIDLLTRA